MGILMRLIEKGVIYFAALLAEFVKDPLVQGTLHKSSRAFLFDLLLLPSSLQNPLQQNLATLRSDQALVVVGAIGLPLLLVERRDLADGFIVREILLCLG
jgi:hypothetical protein